MYWKTKRVLEKNGYNHYEISNFSKKGFESKHNLYCWNQEEYIGFGLAAHSYLNGKRFSNIESFEEYIKNIEENKIEKNIILHENQDREAKAKEYMMLGLRKIDGVSISKFERKFKIHPLFYFRFEISKLEKEGLIEVDLDTIKLTKKGLDFGTRSLLEAIKLDEITDETKEVDEVLEENEETKDEEFDGFVLDEKKKKKFVLFKKKDVKKDMPKNKKSKKEKKVKEKERKDIKEKKHKNGIKIKDKKILVDEKIKLRIE